MDASISFLVHLFQINTSPSSFNSDFTDLLPRLHISSVSFLLPRSIPDLLPSPSFRRLHRASFPVHFRPNPKIDRGITTPSPTPSTLAASPSPPWTLFTLSRDRFVLSVAEGGVSMTKATTTNLSMPSAEAKLGLQVEDLWDVQAPQLDPADKLNTCFEEIPVPSFPRASFSSVEIDSESSLAEAVRVLAKHMLLSAPVVDAHAPKDASWVDRYIGVVEFAGIVVWILQQAEADESLGAALAAGNDETESDSPTAHSRVRRLAKLGSLSPRAARMISGDFFGALTSSKFYKNVKVRDISGSFRWGPFLALQKSNSMLTLLLLLSKYKMKSVPVVESGEAKIDNIVTQSAVIHMLAECIELPWFKTWGNKKLAELHLPAMSREQMIEVYEDEPVLQAFKLMWVNGIGGIPVLEGGGRKAVGNISIRDVQFLLTAPDIYKEYRSMTVKDFLEAARRYREEHGEVLPATSLMQLITCRKETPLKDTILTLDAKKIHRIYVVDDDGNLEGVITLRDIISRLVHEPHGYFGDFFDGCTPNTRG